MKKRVALDLNRSGEGVSPLKKSERRFGAVRRKRLPVKLTIDEGGRKPIRVEPRV